MNEEGKEPGTQEAQEVQEIKESDLLPMFHLEHIYHDPSLLSSALRSHGSFYLLDPPLPPAPWSSASRLFSLSPEDKQSLKHPKGSQIRGYNSDPKSGREWWDLTPESADGCAGPTGDDKFRDEMKKYFDDSVRLLSALTEVLMDTYKEIPERALEQGMSTMRLLRYSKDLIPTASGNDTPKEPPPTPITGVATSQHNQTETQIPSDSTPAIEENEEEGDKGKTTTTTTIGSAIASAGIISGAIGGGSTVMKQPFSVVQAHHAQVSRMQPHTDHGILTLMHANSRGLYVYGPDGRIFAAPPVENAVIIFAADSLCWWTKDEEERILPVPHEVWMAGESERMSLAVFFRPGLDVVLCDKSKEGEKDARDVMTYGRWSYEKGRVKGRRCWLVGRDAFGDPQSATVADQ